MENDWKNSYVLSFNVSRKCDTFGIWTAGGKTHLVCTNAFPRLNLEWFFISWKNAAFPQHVKKVTQKP